METYNLEKEIKVLCATAASFPDGIMAAFKKLESLGDDMCDRTFFGISRPNERGTIVYKAAVQQHDDNEPAKYDAESFTIPSGEYITETILNWKDNMQAFGTAFTKLLDNPKMDHRYPCIEWYKSDTEVMCMIKLKD